MCSNLLWISIGLRSLNHFPRYFVSEFATTYSCIEQG